MVLFISDQMKRTIEFVQSQNTETPEDIREEIINFRNKRLSEEQQEQAHVMTLVYDSFTCAMLYFYQYIFL